MRLTISYPIGLSLLCLTIIGAGAVFLPKNSVSQTNYSPSPISSPFSASDSSCTQTLTPVSSVSSESDLLYQGRLWQEIDKKLVSNALNPDLCYSETTLPTLVKPKLRLTVTKSSILEKRPLPIAWDETLLRQVNQEPVAAPFPQIKDIARRAKVPIMMYHDILPEKEVFFDVTPEELEADFQLIQEQGLTPVSLPQLVEHLQIGTPLPEKPIVLTFDDGYGGHYDYVYPLLKKYNYPATFSIYIKKMEGKTARSSVTWQQVQEMAADPLVTIAAHSVTHPRDLRELSDDELAAEILQSKGILEEKLGIPIKYFTYPEGKWDPRVKQWAIAAGFEAALAMSNTDEHFAGESPDLMTIGRFGQSRLESVVSQAWGGYPLPITGNGFNFDSPIHKEEVMIDNIPIALITGGRPHTIHADSRYQVPEIIEGTGAVAAVDGGFFSLKYLNSNTMIGPVMGSNTGEFIPGYEGEIPKLNGRPLVLISKKWVKFIPFDAEKHNDLTGIIEASGDPMTTVTDVFVGAAWLVKDGQPQPREAFGTLFDFDAYRHRAFWGINQSGQPVVGVSKRPIDSVSLGQMLHQLGLRDAVMLDSGASTSLAYEGASLVGYIPRPVPHVVALFPTENPDLRSPYEQGLACVLSNTCSLENTPVVLSANPN